MRLKAQRYFLRLLFCLSLLELPHCKHRITQKDAETLAQKSLQEYCIQEHLSPETFQTTTVTSEGSCPWVYDYESKTLPKHFVRIYIDKEGKVERHRMVDE